MTKFQELDKLDLHLFTCEVYECGECYIRNTNLSDMKKHIQDTHAHSTRMLYLKMDRNETGEISSKFYSLTEVWRFKNFKLEKDENETCEPIS